MNITKENINELNAIVTVKIEKNDVIIIGSGDNYEKARLSTMNAALTLF